MQWGHIKSLFILSFLLLNIYLIIQFAEKQDAADISVLDSSKSTMEEQLESENITIEANIETDLTEASYTEVTQKNLSDDEISELGKLDNQVPAVINDNYIVSEFEDPVPLPTPVTEEKVSDEVKKHILYPDHYEFWSWDPEMNVLIFFQQREERPIYFNQNGLVLVYLNKNNEMTHYTQTILGEGEAQGGAKTLLQPMQAIGTLYSRGDLNPDETVVDISIGYYARIATEGIQVFAPTWKITVATTEDEERNYFVNAIEGLVYESDNTYFLTEIIKDNITKIETLDKDSEIRDRILDRMNNRLEIENRSEDE